MKRIVATLLLLFVCFFHPAVSHGQDFGAVVTISAYANDRPWAKGYGITIRLTNIDTGEEFESKSLGILSKNAIIEGLPTGRYRITFAEIDFGDVLWNSASNDLQDFFGVILIKAGRIYYLGAYESTYADERKRKVVFTLKDLNVPKKIIRYLDRYGYPTDNIMTRSPFADSFVFAKLTD